MTIEYYKIRSDDRLVGRTLESMEGYGREVTAEWIESRAGFGAFTVAAVRYSEDGDGASYHVLAQTTIGTASPLVARQRAAEFIARYSD